LVSLTLLVRRKMGRFKAVDGNGIRTGTKLKDKGTRGTAKDLVRTRVGWGERGGESPL
jgi:hypothetical protein